MLVYNVTLQEIFQIILLGYMLTVDFRGNYCWKGGLPCPHSPMCMFPSSLHIRTSFCTVNWVQLVTSLFLSFWVDTDLNDNLCQV